MEQTVIERFGSLEKEELLQCVDNELLVHNSCMLESMSPFSGYYDRFTHADKPLYFYLVLEGNYSLEKIWRIILKVRKLFPHDFDAVPGTLEIFDNKVQIIRIRNIKDFNHVVTLQRLFAEQGFTYHKRMKKIDGEIGIIRLDKFFFLEPIGDLMYMDVFQPHHGYFIIPNHFSWTNFKKLTDEVNLDTSLIYFDAANAFFYENHGIIDIIRIYRENLDKEKLFAIRNRYFNVINASFELVESI